MDLRLRPPGSKSLSNRALLLAGLATGRSTITGLLDAEDTQLMQACLRALGVTIEAHEDALVVDSPGRLSTAAGECPLLEVGTAGTVARLLGAALAASPVTVRFDGSERMRERPMAQLLDALVEQGAAIEALGEPGFLPVKIGPHKAPLRGGEIRLARPASSQIVSGLVIAAALTAEPTTIVLEQGTPARPYIDMTLAVLRDFGGEAHWEGHDRLVVQPHPLVARTYAVEPDASAASYPLGLAALYGKRCTIEGLGHTSLQGDVHFARVLERLGAEVEQDGEMTTVTRKGPILGGDFDLTDMPDMTLTLAALAVHARGPTTIQGVEILRHHESDRLAAAATELRKLGATVQEHDDGLQITPPPGGPRPGVAIETYRDHRMAMAFSLVGDVVILDPACVAKTWPEYFSVLRKLGMVVSEGP